jgi:hypothetical protein
MVGWLHNFVDSAWLTACKSRFVFDQISSHQCTLTVKLPALLVHTPFTLYVTVVPAEACTVQTALGSAAIEPDALSLQNPDGIVIVKFVIVPAVQEIT